jgi:hypothetical protein
MNIKVISFLGGGHSEETILPALKFPLRFSREKYIPLYIILKSSSVYVSL